MGEVTKWRLDLEIGRDWVGMATERITLRCRIQSRADFHMAEKLRPLFSEIAIRILRIKLGRFSRFLVFLSMPRSISNPCTANTRGVPLAPHDVLDQSCSTDILSALVARSTS